jgi:hypothetical protein
LYKDGKLGDERLGEMEAWIEMSRCLRSVGDVFRGGKGEMYL